MLSEVRQVERDAAQNLDNIDKYYFARAKLVAKVIKYPSIVSGYLICLCV